MFSMLKWKLHALHWGERAHELEMGLTRGYKNPSSLCWSPGQSSHPSSPLSLPHWSALPAVAEHSLTSLLSCLEEWLSPGAHLAPVGNKSH